MITVGSLFDGITTIYVAGPITGMPDNNRKAFRAAEAYLTNQGLTVLSPEAIQPIHKPERITHGQYMEICLTMIKAVQAVYFLAGWELSKGAKMEHDWARALGKRIIYEDTRPHRDLPMTNDEIRQRYQDGTPVVILAELNGCAHERVSDIIGAGEPVKKRKKRPPAEKRNNDWLEEARQMFGKVPDSTIAAQCGVSQPTVTKYRNQLGIPRAKRTWR